MMWPLRAGATALEEPGTEIWLDVDDIPPGMKWSSAIQEGLDSADVMLVIVSPDSMASSNVEDEWQYALDRGVPVIPVLLEPADVHFQLNRLQYIDFYEHDFDDVLPHLQNAIDIKIAAPESSFRVPGKRLHWPTPTYQQPRWVRYVQFGSYGLVVIIIAAVVIYTNSSPGNNGAISSETSAARNLVLPGTEALPVYTSPVRQGDPMTLNSPTFTLRLVPRDELWYMVESTDESVSGNAYVPADDLVNDARLYAVPLSVNMPGSGLQFYDFPAADAPSTTELGTATLVFVYGFWRAETGDLWYRASKPSGFQHGWLLAPDERLLPYLAGYVTSSDELMLWTEPSSTSTSATLPVASTVRILTATADYYQVLVYLDDEWAIRYVAQDDLFLPGLMQQDLEARTLA